MVCDGSNLYPTVLVLTKTHKLYFTLDVISNKQVRFFFFFFLKRVVRKVGLAVRRQNKAAYALVSKSRDRHTQASGVLAAQMS